MSWRDEADRLQDRLPEVQVVRGGITFPHREVPRRPPVPEVRSYGRGVRTFTAGDFLTIEPMVAAGGWTAPVELLEPRYDFYDLVHRPWLLPDRPWSRDVDVDRWLFPRLARWAARLAGARRRLRAARRHLGLAVAALRSPQTVEVDPDDDQW